MSGYKIVQLYRCLVLLLFGTAFIWLCLFSIDCLALCLFSIMTVWFYVHLALCLFSMAFVWLNVYLAFCLFSILASIKMHYISCLCILSFMFYCSTNNHLVFPYHPTAAQHEGIIVCLCYRVSPLCDKSTMLVGRRNNIED